MEELLSRCPRWVLPGRGRPALCAVSGGLDSMCLLDLLDRWCRKDVYKRQRKALSLLFDAVVEHRTPERDCFYPESPILTAENC